jgi:hypothetical protein
VERVVVGGENVKGDGGNEDEGEVVVVDVAVDADEGEVEDEMTECR